MLHKMRDIEVCINSKYETFMYTFWTVVNMHKIYIDRIVHLKLSSSSESLSHHYQPTRVSESTSLSPTDAGQVKLGLEETLDNRIPLCFLKILWTMFDRKSLRLIWEILMQYRIEDVSVSTIYTRLSS